MCKSSLHVLDIDHLPNTRFACIFSHSSGYPFIFFIVSFETQKILTLIKSNLSVCLAFFFFFVTSAFGVISMKLLPNP